MRKSLLLIGALLGAFAFLSGCGDEEKGGGRVDSALIVPGKKLPHKGIIGVVPLSTGDPQIPRGLSFIYGEDSLIATAEGPVGADKGTVYMAPPRDAQFSSRTVRNATAIRFSRFAGHFYDTKSNALYVCGNPKDVTKKPMVLVLSRQNDGKFVFVKAMEFDSAQTGMNCGGVAVVGDYVFATNRTPKVAADTALFYANVSAAVPAKLSPLQSYADLSFTDQQIAPGVPLIRDIKPKVTQAANQFSVWLLLPTVEKIAGLDFSLNAAALERVGNPKFLEPAGGIQLNLLQTMVPYSDEFFLIVDHDKMYSSRFDSSGRLKKTELLMALTSRSVLSMSLGKDRFGATSLPVLFYLPSPPGESVSLVTEFAFDPDA
ncbi:MULTISPECIES: hypothetical protein [Candidatus Ichthyocystis]|uniref:Putative exported protein n=1 Tax=Candidatus Ichthyocystis hellenicum TaxID=1561003 RepID=A0A0S4M772_9BURK|nr:MULTISPECIES: hypothetical protein [Ichthyocystis]CUT18109.1 putative exported protein [Candidatus Ichthyocystis hellenicum]